MSGHYERLGSSLSRLEPCDQIDAMNKRASAKTAVAKPSARRTNTVARSKQTFDNGQPRYLQIARELKRGIANGAYPVGARLPQSLSCANNSRISRFTARAAIRVLSSPAL